MPGEAKRRKAAGYQPPLPFKTIAEAWRLTAAMSLPPGLTDEQRSVARRLFYIGAMAFFDLTTRLHDPGDEATEADLRRMDGWYAELEAFRSEEAARHGIVQVDLPERAH